MPYKINIQNGIATINEVARMREPMVDDYGLDKSGSDTWEKDWNKWKDYNDNLKSYPCHESLLHLEGKELEEGKDFKLVELVKGLGTGNRGIGYIAIPIKDGDFTFEDAWDKWTRTGQYKADDHEDYFVHLKWLAENYTLVQKNNHGSI